VRLTTAYIVQRRSLMQIHRGGRWGSCRRFAVPPLTIRHGLTNCLFAPYPAACPSTAGCRPSIGECLDADAKEAPVAPTHASMLLPPLRRLRGKQDSVGPSTNDNDFNIGQFTPRDVQWSTDNHRRRRSRHFNSSPTPLSWCSCRRLPLEGARDSATAPGRAYSQLPLPPYYSAPANGHYDGDSFSA
jgi:hypothetical protein